METGRLELFLGSMFSGKSSKIINIYKKWVLCNHKPFVINYSLDNRYSDTANKIVTHDKTEIPCIHNTTLRAIFQPLINNKTITNDDYNIIIINEGQFFEDLYYWCELLVNTYNKYIYIAALNADFEKKPFDQISKLIPEANVIEQLQAICSGCKDGTPALHSYRVSNETGRILIGSNNYIPLCRKCYNQNNQIVNISTKEMIPWKKKAQDKYSKSFTEINEQKKCRVCQSLAIFNCSNCEHAYYCSEICQKIDWINHEPNCLNISK